MKHGGTPKSKKPCCSGIFRFYFRRFGKRYGKIIALCMIFALWAAHVGVTADYALK